MKNGDQIVIGLVTETLRVPLQLAIDFVRREWKRKKLGEWTNRKEINIPVVVFRTWRVTGCLVSVGDYIRICRFSFIRWVGPGDSCTFDPEQLVLNLED